MTPPSIHDYPSFAAYVRLRRMRSTPFSVRRASVAAGLPEGTWGSLENGRLPRPSPANLHAIAHVLVVRTWPLALVAGIKPASPLNRLAGLLTDQLPQPEWWNIRGGAFMRFARESAGRNYETVAKTWLTKWPAIPALGSIDAWEALEAQGILPSLPSPPPQARQPQPKKDLAKLSGAWWWAILDAAVNDDQQALYLLPGFAVVVGEAHPEIARKSDELTAWEQLVGAYRQSHSRKPEDFDDAAYFAVSVQVAQDMLSEAGVETASQRLARISAVWEKLTQEQQEHVVAITADLAKHN